MSVSTCFAKACFRSVQASSVEALVRKLSCEKAGRSEIEFLRMGLWKRIPGIISMAMVSDASHYQWQVKVNPGIQIPKNVIVPTRGGGAPQLSVHDGVIPRGLRFYLSLEFLFSRSAVENEAFYVPFHSGIWFLVD